MKVNTTFEVSEDYRRGIAFYYGEDGLASYDTCKLFLRLHGLDGLRTAHQKMNEERKRIATVIIDQLFMEEL